MRTRLGAAGDRPASHLALPATLAFVVLAGVASFGACSSKDSASGGGGGTGGIARTSDPSGGAGPSGPGGSGPGGSGIGGSGIGGSGIGGSGGGTGGGAVGPSSSSAGGGMFG